jgi:hypothetical protein
MDMQQFRQNVLSFIAVHRLSGGVGRYRYSLVAQNPTLYSSAYAAMTRSLLNDLDSLSASDRREWIDYFNHHQGDEGLYLDPAIYNQGWYENDPLWCGRSHLTCHVLSALACLGGVAKKPFRWLNQFYSIEEFLTSRNWTDGVDTTGNEIMNVGTILQYARDFHYDDRAGKAVEVLLAWLDAHWINPKTGVWGTMDIVDPMNRSRLVQAAYHWWDLYFYDHHPIPYVERAIDTVLLTQNSRGGFGCGIHNPDTPYHSSACEDIDSIDPLVRMSRQTDYRNTDIQIALTRGLDWLIQNQMPDGGFVFMLDKPFEYGHTELGGLKNTGAMFPTWFRTLTVSLLAQGLPDSWAGNYPWYFVRCPGYQFWSIPNDKKRS